MRLGGLLVAALSSLVLVSASGCGMATRDGSSDGVASSRATTYTALKGPEWLRCWMTQDTSTSDTFFQRDPLTCRHPSLDPSYPIKLKQLIVYAEDSQGNAGPVLTLTDTPDTDVVVAKISPDRFPLKITAQAVFDPGDPMVESLGITPDIGVIETTTSIASVAAAPVDNAVSLHQPFDLWKVGVIDDLGMYTFQGDARNASLAPFVVGQSTDAKSDVVVRTMLSSQQDTRHDFYVLAPASGGVSGRYFPTLAAPVAATIPGPGLYHATTTGFVAATDADEPANDAGAGPSSPTTSDDAGTPDAAPASTCGGDGQDACIDSNGNRVCNPGTRWDPTGYKCVACGADKQTYCEDSNGNRVCNAGTRYDPTSYECVACGADKETYCEDSNGNRVCNAGTRYDATSYECVACGNAGQTYCEDSNGNRVCNAPSTYDPSSYSCVAP